MEVGREKRREMGDTEGEDEKGRGAGRERDLSVNSLKGKGRAGAGGGWRGVGWIWSRFFHKDWLGPCHLFLQGEFMTGQHAALGH